MMEANATFCRLRFEVRGCITDLQSHRSSPFTLVSRVPWGGRLHAGDIVSSPVSAYDAHTGSLAQDAGTHPNGCPFGCVAGDSPQGWRFLACRVHRTLVYRLAAHG